MDLDILIRRIAEVGGCATIIPGNGKRPIGPWKDTPVGTRDVSGDTHLLLCGRSGVFVVDCDDDDAIRAFGVHNTFTVATARGAHFYFKHPGFDFTDAPIAPKTDIKNHGYVVAPGSPDKHVMMDIPIAEAPAALLEILRNRPRPERVTDWFAETPDGATIDRAIEILQRVPATEDGDGGAKALIAAGYLKGLKIPRTEAIDLLEKVYSPRCAYPWTRAELDHKLTDAEVLWEAPKALQHTVLETYQNDDPKKIDFSLPVPPVVWSIRSIFEKDSVNMLVAHPGSMKTWALLDMARSLAQGKFWLGKFEVKQCNVLFLDWESNESKLRRRMKILTKSPVPGFYYKRNWGNLYEEEFWRSVTRFVKSESIGAIFYDSFSAGSGMQDEFVKNAAAPLLRAGALDDVTHVFIHHSKKGDSKSYEVARGTTAIQAAADTIYRFTIPEGATNSVLRCQMIVAKVGEGDQCPAVSLKLSDADGLQLDTDVEKKLLVGGKKSQEMLEAEILLLLRQEPLSENQIQSKLGGQRPPIKLACACLRDTHKIFKQGTGSVQRWVFVDHGVQRDDG